MIGPKFHLLLPILTVETLNIHLQMLLLHLEDIQGKATISTPCYLDNNLLPHSLIHSLIKVREKARNREEKTLRGSANTSHRNTIRQQACAANIHTTANVTYHIILLLTNVLLRVHFTRLLVLILSNVINKFLTSKTMFPLV